ncbi:MAG: hypothetical protein U0Q11_04635 [Vicinamibacterales bacterium]
MGRPYKSELAAVPHTLEWATTADISGMARIVETIASRPLLVIGSGGSVTACHLIAKLQSEHPRQPVRVLTPYEFLLQPADGLSSVLLLSAGGSNRDILRAASKAVSESYESVCAVVARAASPLRSLLAECPHTLHAGFDVPFGKDGFLAVNSLLATTVLIARAYASVFGIPWVAPTLDDFVAPSIDAALRPSIIVLAAGWSWPAALDMESKFNEAGLGTVVCTDHRNFAHGRHHGLARRAEVSGVVALSTPDCHPMALRTLRLIPQTIPRLHLKTKSNGATGSVDLIHQVFKLVERVADQRGVDPGRPQVADFGRRLYGLPSVGQRRTPPVVDVWIQRKVSCHVWNLAADEQRDEWRAGYRRWAEIIENSTFSSVALDYDGTLCESYERAGRPRALVALALENMLGEGIRLGVATGRGDSVLDALRASIPRAHHPDVIVGLYNGAVIGSLDDVKDRLAEIQRVEVVSLTQVAAALDASPLLRMIAVVRRRQVQLTITQRRPLPAGFLVRHVLEILSQDDVVRDSCTVHESGHSVDVIPSGVSKLAVVKALEAHSSHGVLTIGDQGQLRGNDFAFLSRPASLSVERVSTALDRCWNLAAAGSRGTTALARYLAALQPTRSTGYRLDVAMLERS